jgi:hypothetical protein
MTWPLPDLNRRLHRLIWLSTRDHHGRVNSELVVESEMAFMLEIVVFINIYTLKLCLTSRLRMDCGAEYKSGPDQACGNFIVDRSPSSQGFVFPWCAPCPHPHSRALASNVLRSPPTSRALGFGLATLKKLQEAGISFRLSSLLPKFSSLR